MNAAAESAAAAERLAHDSALESSSLGHVPFQHPQHHPFLANLVKQEQELVSPLPPPLTLTRGINSFHASRRFHNITVFRFTSLTRAGCPAAHHWPPGSFNRAAGRRGACHCIAAPRFSISSPLQVVCLPVLSTRHSLNRRVKMCCLQVEALIEHVRTREAKARRHVVLQV